MSSKQTAVEWLLEQTIYLRSTKWPDIVQKAIEMQKEQIVDAFNAGQAEEAVDPFWTKGINYYQEKYG